MTQDWWSQNPKSGAEQDRAGHGRKWQAEFLKYREIRVSQVTQNRGSQSTEVAVALVTKSEIE